MVVKVLTERKKAFADALLAGSTKSEAAIAAGLSAKTAAQAGSRLAKDKDVGAYLKKAKREAKTGQHGGFSPTGVKTPDAPPGWPFGTTPPAAGAEPEPPKRQTAREFLSDQVNDTELDIKLRLDAAKKLIEFEEAKPAPKGKKEGQKEEARKLSRFTPAAPPRLAAAGGKRI